MNPRTYVLSTEGMVKHAAESAADTFVVATETGILHRLNKEIPGKPSSPPTPAPSVAT